MYDDAVNAFDEIEDDVTLLCAVKSGNLEPENGKTKYTEINALVTSMCGGLNAILGKMKQHHLTYLG